MPEDGETKNFDIRCRDEDCRKRFTVVGRWRGDFATGYFMCTSCGEKMHLEEGWDVVRGAGDYN